MLRAAGTRTLNVSYYGNVTCYQKEQVTLRLITKPSGAKAAGRFTLILREP